MSAGVRKVWVVVLALLASIALGGTRPSVAQEGAARIEQPPVGGLFGLFGAGRRAASPTPKPSAPRLEAPSAAEPTAKSARPSPTATETATPAPKETPRPITTPRPIVTPESAVIPSPAPTEVSEPTPTPPVGSGRKGKGKPTATVEPTATPSPEAEQEGMEPLGIPEPEATEEPLEEATPRAAPREPATRDEVPADPQGTGPSGKADVQLPNVEIQGDLERPDIFFVMPRAKDLSDEQLMRARIKREITRPVIKDWVEEEMLLK